MAGRVSGRSVNVRKQYAVYAWVQYACVHYPLAGSAWAVWG